MAFLNHKEVGNRLKISREKLDLVPRKFAMSAGVDPSQYSKIEKGQLPITPNILKKIVERYNLDENYILYGTNVPRDTVSAQNIDQGKADYQSLYLQSILEQKRILEEQNQFLRRNFEVSLSSIAEAQQIEIAHLKALSWYSAHVQAGENDQQTTKELMKINMRVGEFLQVTAKKDS